MSSIAQCLFDEIERLDAHHKLPRVVSFHFSPEGEEGTRRNNFAYLRLDDGSIGLTYVALDDALPLLQKHVPTMELSGMSAIELASLYLEPASWQRALGLAAINAISQYILARGRSMLTMPDNLVALSPDAHEHIGMVGYFGRVVEPLRQSNIELTVIELDESQLRNEPGLTVTLDATRLASCTQVIITGTTLLNHSLERMLEYCSNARRILLLGPSASCLAEPLFSAGVTLVGGFHVTDAAMFERRWQQRGRWRDAGRRYCLISQN